MEDLLVQAGLTEVQAATYLWLLEHGENSPPLVAKALIITRTNAYKVLDSLQELGLAQRSEIRKKIMYRAAPPSALASLVAEERNRVIALEHSVGEAMQQLRGKYRKSTSGSTITSEDGQAAVVTAYERQAEQKEPIYFIKSRADIPTIGFETMDRVRRLPALHDTRRYGITPDSPEAALNPQLDKNTLLTRTWVDADAYTAPVEWTVSGDELLIINFDGESSVVRVKSHAIAQSFRELWQLLDVGLRQSPGYKKLPRQAKRKI